MRALKTVALGAAMMMAVTFSSQSREDQIVIKDDGGGVVVDFIKKYEDMRASGAKLVIDGPCASACTLFVGIVDNACVTKNAGLGFHTAFTEFKGVKEHSPEFTKLLFALYPEKLRKELRRRGLDGWNHPENPHPKLVWIQGKDLERFVKPCGSP